MAAYTTTYSGFEAGLSFEARAAERNAELMAQQAQRRRGVRTPEFHFAKSFDNSRLVKAPDPVRVREMRVFSAAMAFFFTLVMIYGLQHFYAIEDGQQVEAEKQQIKQLIEENGQLRLAEAQLAQPERIDLLARQLGLAKPQPGQVVHPSAGLEPGAPVLAQVTPPGR